MASIRSTLREAVDSISILDTHEHLRTAGDWSAEHIDLETVCRGYLSWMVPEAISADGRASDAWWARLEPRLELHQALAFYRCLLAAFRDLYGLAGEGLNSSNWRELSARIHAAHQDLAWFRRVLQERAGIDRILHDRYWQVGPLPPDADYLLPVLRLDAFFHGYHRQARDHDDNSPYSWLDSQGGAYDRLDQYLDAVAKAVDEGARRNAPCLKLAIAYDRDLAFQRPDYQLAETAFGCPAEDLSPTQIRAFQDSVLYTALESARQHRLPVQVHTGLAQIHGSNPINFVPVIADFPDVRFILFHGGYPWTAEAGAIAFSYPNVWVDLVWMPIISPSASQRALHEWLDLGLGPRICWGGDCWTAEEAYGAAVFGRQVIREVLAEKVESGAFSLDHAHLLARRMLRENALDLYGL